MNHNTELYDSITNAKIKQSLYTATTLILKDPDKNFDVTVSTFIAVAGYIGSFISVFDIGLFFDAIRDLIGLIEDEKIVIQNIHILTTKLCIICGIYIKHPITRTGVTNVKLLRPKIIDIFTNEKFKLTDTGISVFEGILPPVDSPSYQLATQIITGYVYIIKELDQLCVSMSPDAISDIAVKIRASFDYIIRKKYSFETKFYESDCDPVWFLWGIVSILYKDHEMDALYHLFNIGYCKKTRQSRIGLLWAAGIAMVYVKKRDIARSWNEKEILVIKKIEEASMQLYKDIKRELLETGEIVQEHKPKADGLDYIFSMRHTIGNTDKKELEAVSDSSVKSIKYQHKFY